MSLMDRIHDDVAKHLNLPPGSRVTKIEEDHSVTGGCDTCGYGEMDHFTVYISVVDSSGRFKSYTESVSLVDFLSNIK